MSLMNHQKNLDLLHQTDLEQSLPVIDDRATLIRSVGSPVWGRSDVNCQCMLRESLQWDLCRFPSFEPLFQLERVAKIMLSHVRSRLV
jgi:hypothetical protein